MDRSTENGRAWAGLDVPNMMTAKELEALLRIDVKTIYSYVQRGLIPYVRIQSNVRFMRRQIMEWVQANSFGPIPAQKRRPAEVAISRASSPRRPKA